ncbi:MAG: flagellar motor protein MotB, partial [Anaerovoracaceae bacterium]
MARIRRKKPINVDAWLNTYADMITLVLVFFILLFSMSSMDQEKYRLLVKAFTADPETLEQLMIEESDLEEGSPQTEQPVVGEDIELTEIDDLDQLYLYLRNYVDQNNLQASVQVEKSENVVYVRFMSSLFFEPDRAVLKAGGRVILEHVGEALTQVEEIARFIRIDG